LDNLEDNKSRKIKKLLPFLRWGEVFVLVLIISSCSSQPSPYNLFSFSGETMGTTYEVKIVLPKEANLPEGVGEKIHGCLSQIDQLMSTYKNDSELSQFNQYIEEKPFPISKEMREVFEISLKVAKETEGAFDITIFPLIELWGFGPKMAEKPPSKEQIEEAQKKVGYQKIELLPEGILKHDPEVRCDLSAVAKGYAVDKVAELLDQYGFGSYMVEVGGEVRVKGEKYPGTTWSIGIENPISMERSIYRVVKLNKGAMATSGNYRNFYIWDGKRYSHEVDPRTGYPVPNTLASVSVFYSSCAYADAYATAFMVMGLEKAFQLAEEKKIPAFFIYPISDTQFKGRATSTWNQEQSGK